MLTDIRRDDNEGGFLIPAEIATADLIEKLNAMCVNPPEADEQDEIPATLVWLPKELIQGD